MKQAGWAGVLLGAMLWMVVLAPQPAEACNRTCPAGTKRDPRGCCIEAPKPKPKPAKRAKPAPVLKGAAGGVCFRNGTCDGGLRCDGTRCKAILEGTAGGRCFRNGTCDARLVCNAERVCELDAAEVAREAAQREAAAARAADEAAARVLAEGEGAAGVTQRAAVSGRPDGIEWVRIEGGVLEMGSDNGDKDEKPGRRVSVATFELMKAEVSVGQYRACVDAGRCTPVGTSDACNWDKSGREDHPINCVSWEDASAFAGWVSGRLPSEAEWEFAARSGGREQKYPWGDAEATCQYAMMDDGGGNGCGAGDTTARVCSKPSGNSAQGVCDLAGNVWEWVEDWYGPYGEAPSDGSAKSRAAEERVFRGGCWMDSAGYLRAADRGRYPPGFRNDRLGFRIAR